MSWSGGTYTKGNNGTGGWVGDAALGITIEPTRHDTQDNDFATGINNCLAKDGQNSMTNNLNFGGYRPSNIAAGTFAAPAICAGNDVDTGMYSPGANQIGFATAGIERVTIDSSGGVSLSQAGSSPVARFSLLQYSNDNQTSQLHFYKSKAASLGGNTIVANGDQIGMLRFYGANGTGYNEGARITATIDGTPGATNDMPTYLAFSTTSDGSGVPTERMRIRSDGNVGIASTGSASARLTIIGEDTGTSNYSLVTYGSSGVSANGLVVRNDGRVGIGTATLNAKTVIAGESTTLPVLRLLGGGAGDVANRALEIFKTDNDSTTSQNFVYFYINNGSTASGKINANGANAAAFGSTSDIRLKENVVDLPSQLDAILSLRPVEFDYKDGSGHQIGFIAQEVQEIFPDLIGEADGYLTLTDLNKNDARMIKAFQELAAKVEALEAKVQALEAVTEV